MIKHTDGPWIANDKHSDSNYPWRIESDANGYPNDGYIIAKLDGPDAEANARLIAAAPDLLEALKPFANFACTPPCLCQNCKARDAVNKAIAE